MRMTTRVLTALVLLLSLIVGPMSAAPINAQEAKSIAQATPAAAPPPLPPPTPAATTGTLSGTVTDATSNTPIGGAVVTATGGGGNTQTASTKGDGTFSLSLPPGIYDVVINKGGFQTSTIPAVAVAVGATLNLGIAIAEANLTSLRTISRVTVSRTTSLNTSTASIATLNSEVLSQRALPNLTDTVGDLPGISVARTTGATANTFFVVRGAFTETKVNIDGHPLSSGTFGNWNSNYASSGIFDQIEVLKGAGLNGPTAGESAIGTINIRTRDFSPGNSAEISLGTDSFRGGQYAFFGSANALKDNRLSLVVGKSFTGYNGPYDQYFPIRVGSVTPTTPGIGQVPTITGLAQWVGDFSNRYALEGELAKLRYRFSKSTSITLEYLGLQGQYQPQGGSYGSYQGRTLVAPCFNGSTPATDPSQCSVTSGYNPPYASNLIGQTVDSYFWFPNSFIQNNEPQFTAELRTSFKNDTVLVRPYTALINRFISGDFENQYPGNGGGWSQVTNPANCQAVFVSPTVAAGGAKGPCFSGATTSLNAPAFVGTDQTPIVFPTTSTAPICSPQIPCYTTVTRQANDGRWGYGTPFSQPEVDRLHGVTFTYLHPVGNNLYNFSYDYNSEDTSSQTNDTTIPPAGCTPVVGTNVANLVMGTGGNTALRQPTCSLLALPRSSIGVPSTQIRKNDFSLTGAFQVNSKLRIDLGAYVTNYKANAQTEDPSVLAAFGANKTVTGSNGTPIVIPGNGFAAPVALVPFSTTFSHFDPHLGLSYRATRDLALRLTAGSSIGTPYASQISGLGSVDLPNGANNQTYTLSIANPALVPETIVALDVGGDLRLPDGGILSLDVYNDRIHNAFAQQKTPIPPVTGFPATGTFLQSITLNGSLLRLYGAELAITKTPPAGFGYILNASVERAYLDQLPASIYANGPSNLINGRQLDGFSFGSGSIPYAKGYGEVRFAGVNGSLFTFGANYQGSNNSTYGPAYTLFNASVRLPIVGLGLFRISGDNIFNYNTGSQLGRALFNQGTQSLTLTQGPNGTLVPGASINRSLQQVNFRTYRFILTRKI